MNNNKNYVGTYIICSFIMLLVFVVLLVLKTTIATNIPWWGVLAPLWVPPCIAELALSMILIAIVIKGKVSDKYIVKELNDD